MIDDVANMCDGVEGYNFLEVIECGVTIVGIWERGDNCSTGPGDDRGQEDTDKNRAFDVVHNEKDCQDTGREN